MRKLGESVYSHYAQKLNKDVSFPEDGYQGKYIIDIAEKLIDDFSLLPDAQTKVKKMANKQKLKVAKFLFKTRKRIEKTPELEKLIT